MDGEHVGAAKAEDQEHLDGPRADSAHGDEAVDQFLVGHFVGFFERGHDAVDCFLREIFHGQDFCAGETGFSERGLFEFEHFLWGGWTAPGAEGFHARVNRGGGFAGDGLVGDGFEQCFVGGLGVVDLRLEGRGFVNEAGDAGVAVGEMGYGRGQVEGKCGERLVDHGAVLRRQMRITQKP